MAKKDGVRTAAKRKPHWAEFSQRMAISTVVSVINKKWSQGIAFESDEACNDSDQLARLMTLLSQYNQVQSCKTSIKLKILSLMILFKKL